MYSFDDHKFGKCTDERTVNVEIARRPPGLTLHDWYNFAAKICAYLNGLPVSGQSNKSEASNRNKRIAIDRPTILAIDYRPDGTIAAVSQETESGKTVQIFALGDSTPQTVASVRAPVGWLYRGKGTATRWHFMQDADTLAEMEKTGNYEIKPVYL